MLASIRALLFQLIENLLKDAGYAVRTFVRSPAFPLCLTLLLALGICISTVMFSVVDRLLLEPVPSPNADRLLTFRALGGGQQALDYWGGENRAFERVALYAGGSALLLRGQAGERIRVATVTSDFFRMFGAVPLFGRTFPAAEQTAGQDRVAVLSYPLWKRLGADRTIAGADIKLNGVAHTVIGVMRADFRFPPETDAWVPEILAGAPSLELDEKQSDSFEKAEVGLLRPGATAEQAQAEYRILFDRFSTEQKRLNPRSSAGNLHESMLPHSLAQNISRQYSVPVLSLFGAVLFVLAIVCANAASLLMARAATRHQETSIRLCLGAGRARILQQLMVEAGVLILASGILGVLLSQWAVEAIRSVGSGYIPRLGGTVLNGRVLAFALSVSLMTTLLVGLAPALQALSIGMNRGLHHRARATGTVRQPFRRLLGTVQIALALVLSIGASLMLRTLHEFLQVKRGFVTERVIAASLALPATKYADSRRRLDFWESLQAQSARLPGVVAAGVGGIPLESGAGLSLDLGPGPGPPSQQYRICEYLSVGGNYFDALGIGLLHGRTFDARDTANSPKVMIVGEALAKLISPDGRAVGESVRIEGEAAKREIVGVVANIKLSPPRIGGYEQWARPEAQFYVPVSQPPFRFAISPATDLIVRTAGDPRDMAAWLEKLAVSLDADARLYRVRTMDEVLAETTAVPRYGAILLSGFAMAGLLIAALGVYAVAAYSTACRKKEFAIRISVGARPADILRLVLREALHLGLLGVIGGLFSALALTRLVSGLLFRVSAIDPLAFTAAFVLVFVSVLFASMLPAARAMRTEPMLALRSE